MRHQHQDIMGRLIQIGDYIVFPQPGYGHNGGMAPLGLGEVVGTTKGGVRIKYLDENWQYKKQARGHYRQTDTPQTHFNGSARKDYYGNILYEKEWVIDEWVEMEPVLIKSTTDRYFVVERP